MSTNGIDESELIRDSISKTLDGKLLSATIEIDATQFRKPHEVGSVISEVIKSKGYSVEYSCQSHDGEGHFYHYTVRRNQNA